MVVKLDSSGCREESTVGPAGKIVSVWRIECYRNKKVFRREEKARGGINHFEYMGQGGKKYRERESNQRGMPCICKNEKDREAPKEKGGAPKNNSN